jgi:hypothetical protein
MPHTAESANLAIDFRTYYDLETYLFDTVSRRFAEEHTLTAFDFFCIVIWKANRQVKNSSAPYVIRVLPRS